MATQALATNGAGIYVAPFLPPGMYEITATKAGFAKVLRTNLTLQVGQTLTIDIPLPLQTTTETVTVTGEPSVVDTQKTDMSQVVSPTQQENLPLAGRRWESFALLTPNVTTDGGSGLVSYRGISGLYNSSAVDGANNSQAFFSETKGRTTIPYIYSMDSIQEFQVTSSNYSAELGQAAGGDRQRGDQVRHQRTPWRFVLLSCAIPTLNALDPLQKSKGIYTQPIHQQQQFGGSVGGPIIKDKLFYFFTYDGSRKINPISFTSTSDIPARLQLRADCRRRSARRRKTYLTSLLGAYPRFQNQDVGLWQAGLSVHSRQPRQRLVQSGQFQVAELLQHGDHLEQQFEYGQRHRRDSRAHFRRQLGFDHQSDHHQQLPLPVVAGSGNHRRQRYRLPA